MTTLTTSTRAVARFANAISSRHLRSEGDVSGDVDALIAAGWVRDSLATRLYRLRVEFDAVRSACRAAERRIEVAREHAKAAERRAIPDVLLLPEEPTPLMLIARALAIQADELAKNERQFILTQLRSFEATREALFNFVIAQGGRFYGRLGRFPDEQRVEAFRDLTARILDDFLNGECERCAGVKYVTRGTMGGAVMCPSCRGSGIRRFRCAQDALDRDTRFAETILATLERKFDRVNGLLERFLR